MGGGGARGGGGGRVGRGGRVGGGAGQQVPEPGEEIVGGDVGVHRVLPQVGLELQQRDPVFRGGAGGRVGDLVQAGRKPGGDLVEVLQRKLVGEHQGQARAFQHGQGVLDLLQGRRLRGGQQRFQVQDVAALLHQGRQLGVGRAGQCHHLGDPLGELLQTQGALQQRQTVLTDLDEHVLQDILGNRTGNPAR